jgi:serine phosphatase RsbU (regulator of sigma subunit)
MNKMKNYFIGAYLAKTDNVFEKARIELVYNFSVVFLLLGLLFYFNIIAHGLQYQFYLISVGVVGLAVMPFILKYKEDMRLAAWVWIVQQNIVGLGTTLLEEGKLDIMGGFWMMVQLLFSFFVLTGPSLYVAVALPVVELALSVANSLSGNRLLDFGVPASEKLPDAPLVILIPFTLNVYLLWLFIKNRRVAEGKIQEQKAELEYKNKEVTDSINYAQRIQRAILPSQQLIESYLPQSFIVYLPKDIVSGDFYWVEKKGDTVFFAVADCTGHGVPGAMMSVICENALNRVLKEFNITKPAQMLDKLSTLVEESFEKSGASMRDGMDIALCALNQSLNTLEFAGANNPVYIVRNGSATVAETRGNKQPIGWYEAKKPFTNHEIKLEKGDAVFLFSDGIADQFGGPQGKKFKYKRVKEALALNARLGMNDQKKNITRVYADWKGNIEQVDDVCLMGLRV